MLKRINVYFIFILFAASLWGMAGIFVRTASKYRVSEMELVFGRAALTSLIMAVIILFKNKAYFKVKLKDLWLFVSAGLFSIVLFNYSYYTTMRLSSLSVAAVLLYTAPFFVVFISRIVFKIKLTLNKCIACVVAFIGCCMVSGLFDSTHRIGMRALFFGLLTGFGYALYTIFGELLLMRGYKTFTITFYVFLFAGICSLPLVNLRGVAATLKAEPSAFGIVFLMALFNTVIPYMFYTTGLLGVDPSTAPIIATVEPVVATLVGFFCFKEEITLWGGMGIIFVLASVVILNMKRVSIKANAKINLILSVNGKREDGYHLIDTVMQSVSLADSITITPGKTLKIKCNDKSLETKENIAYKAAELFLRESGIKKGARIAIKKRIPIAAGLGGGSADAAAVLLGLAKLYGVDFKKEKLTEMALILGADVPFFIEGGTVRAEGIGEKLTALESFNGGWFLLVKDDKKPSTGEMYAQLDRKCPTPLEVDKFIEKLTARKLLEAAKLMDNSFRLVWQDNKTEKCLEAFSPVAVSLSGSGPTCFAFFSEKNAAKLAYKQLKKEKKECYLVKPLDKAIIFE